MSAQALRLYDRTWNCGHERREEPSGRDKGLLTIPRSGLVRAACRSGHAIISSAVIRLRLEDGCNSLVALRNLTEQLLDLSFVDPVGQGARVVCTLMPMLRGSRGAPHIALG